MKLANLSKREGLLQIVRAEREPGIRKLRRIAIGGNGVFGCAEDAGGEGPALHSELRAARIPIAGMRYKFAEFGQGNFRFFTRAGGAAENVL